MMNSKEFLERLKDITPDEINEIIEAKGKQRKPIRPFIIDYDKNNK